MKSAQQAAPAGQKRTSTDIQSRLDDVIASLNSGISDPVKRLHAIQERLSLQARLATSKPARRSR
jgi:hypothetical protein